MPFHHTVSDTLNAAEIPFAITAGNHDASLSKKFKLERQIYQQQWLNRVPNVNFIDRTHYPGYKDGITHVSQPCLGSGLRKYIGSSTRSKQGYTMIEIDEENKIKITAYESSNFNKPIDIKQLPRQIKSRYATLNGIFL